MCGISHSIVNLRLDLAHAIELLMHKAIEGAQAVSDNLSGICDASDRP